MLTCGGFSEINSGCLLLPFRDPLQMFTGVYMLKADLAEYPVFWLCRGNSPNLVVTTSS